MSETDYSRIKTRIIHKHGTESDWKQAVNFVPKQGELIIYDDRYVDENGKVVVVADQVRYKIGDGVRLVNDLPFASAEDLPIKNGEGDHSLVINDGSATGEYSIAGGTTDKDFISGIMGSFAGMLTKVNPSEAIGPLSISLGADNKANSAASLAMGYKNISGGKGYYVTAINTTNKTLTLSSKQTSTSNPGTVNWSKGDRLLMINDERYWLDVVSVSENIITVADIPFSKLVSVNSLTSAPNERSIININKPENGVVALGWGAFGIGTQNTVVGSNGYAVGFENIVAGDFGTAFGQENTVGYSAFATGIENKAEGKASFASGDHTTATGFASHTEGYATVASEYGAHAEGSETKATGDRAHAEGKETIASGSRSHAEGGMTRAEGDYSHAEGGGSKAGGDRAHAEGYETTADGTQSHAEGLLTKATGSQAHAEGYSTQATANSAHSEGDTTQATAENSHAEGKGTIASALNAHAEGTSSKAQGEASHAEGVNTQAQGKGSHSEGYLSSATSDMAHAEGKETVASGPSAHAEGSFAEASGPQAHAEGYNTLATKDASHAEGEGTQATEPNTHAEGERTKASARNAHSEGYETTASGYSSHAEGYRTTSDGYAAHAEGAGTKGSGQHAHAEGQGTTASGNNAHAEGVSTVASGGSSHAEGYATKANGNSSHTEGDQSVVNAGTEAAHAEGKGTIASCDAQHVQGKFNVEDTEKKYAHIVGNGSWTGDRKNIHTVDWSGNAWFAGNVDAKTVNADSLNIKKITAPVGELDELNANNAKISDLTATSMSSRDASVQYVVSEFTTTENLTTTNTKTTELEVTNSIKFAGATVTDELTTKKYADSTFTNILIGEVTGTSIKHDVTDVSPVDKTLRITYPGMKNFIRYPFEETTKTMDGVTFTDNGDGTITINGTIDNAYSKEFCFGTFYVPSNMNYFLSGIPASYDSYMSIELSSYSGSFYAEGEGRSMYLEQDPIDLGGTPGFSCVTIRIIVYGEPGKVFDNVIIKPQLEQGLEKTEFESGVETKILVWKSNSKNLWDMQPMLSSNGVTRSNVTAYVSNKEIRLVSSDDYSGNGYYSTAKKLRDFIPNATVGETYTLSFTKSSSSASNIFYVGEAWSNGTSKVLTETMLNTVLTVYGSNTAGETNIISNIQIEKGSSKTSYEGPSEYTAGTDGSIILNSDDVYRISTVNNDVNITVKYSRDINAAILQLQKAIIALGGNL